MFGECIEHIYVCIWKRCSKHHKNPLITDTFYVQDSLHQLLTKDRLSAKNKVEPTADAMSTWFFHNCSDNKMYE